MRTECHYLEDCGFKKVVYENGEFVLKCDYNQKDYCLYYLE
jgi:hypothetical protein